MKLAHQDHTPLHITISALAIVCLCYLLYSWVLDSRFPERIVFQDANITYSSDTNFESNNYLGRDSYGRFLIAGSAPTELGLGIVFDDRAKLIMSVRGEYQAGDCGAGGYNLARLLWHGSERDHKFALIDGKAKELVLSVSKKDEFKFSIENTVNKACGRARVTFIQNQNLWLALAGSTVGWLLLILFCGWIRTSPYLVVLGAILHLFLVAADASINTLTFSNFWLDYSIAAFLCSVLILFAALSIRSILLSGLLSLVILACFTYPLTFLSHQWVLSSPLSSDSIHAIMQSYLDQAMEFWVEFLGLKFLLPTIISFVLIFLLVDYLNRYRWRAKKAINLVVGLILFGLSSTHVYHTIWKSNSAVLIRDSIAAYRQEIEAFHAVARLRQINPVNALRDNGFSNTSTVFVIGESVNKNHMSAYGYPRNTTPNIDRRIDSGQVIRFNNAYSNHTHSNPTVSYMLTGANQYNGKEWISTPSILNYVRAVNLKSTWLSNHRMLGGWSNHITAIAKGADSVMTINTRVGKGNAASQYDGDLIPLFEKAIVKNSNQALFLQ